MDDEIEYADNFVSNLMADASKTVTPNWCQSEDHWTAKVTEYLWADCPCCLLFRGLTLGMLAGSLAGFLIGKVM